MRLLFSALIMAILVAGCSSYVQTTSGKAYLEQSAINADDFELDDAFRKAAAVEPLLTFPARIGIARIENGRLTDIPAEDLDEWANAFAPLASQYGEFVPVNLFITDLVAPDTDFSGPEILANRATLRREAINRIRLGAARQHLDAVIVYEAFTSSQTRNTKLAMADLTLIGAYLAPGRRIDAKGVATALLFDVRNGYPYGMATVSVDDDTHAAAFSTGSARTALQESVKTQAVRKLATELATSTFPNLRDELTSKRQAAIEEN